MGDTLGESGENVDEKLKAIRWLQPPCLPLPFLKLFLAFQRSDRRKRDTKNVLGQLQRQR
jgi:hypothetical protein